jgi:hypothetical protein
MMKAIEKPMPTPKEKKFIYAEYEDNTVLRNDDKFTTRYMT